MRKSRLNWITIGIFVITLLVHGSIIFTLFPTHVVFKYQILAQQYLQGQIDPERLLDVSPFYFYVHVLARKYLTDPNTVILWSQIALSACAAVFLFRLLHACFALPLALFGTLVFFTNRSVILYTGTFEPEACMIFFLLGFLWFALRTDSLSPLLSGVFLSLSILTRANFFPLIFGAPLFFWLTRQHKTRLLRTIVLFEAPVLIAAALLMIRNTMIVGSFTPFSMNPGYVFFEGNNPNSTGESAIYPPLIQDVRADFAPQPDAQHVMYRLFARRIAGDARAIPQINAYWAQKAKNFIRDHPRYALKLLGLKAYFFFHNFRRHDLANVYWNDQRLQQKIPTFPYALLAVLALVGMVVALKYWKQRLLWYLVFCSQFGIVLLIYVSDRQRVVLLGVMVFFAAEAIQAGCRQKKILLLLILMLLLSPIFFVEHDLMKDDTYTWNRYALSEKLLGEAKLARKQGNFLLASEKNALSFALAPGLMDNRRLSELRFSPKPFQDRAFELAREFPAQDCSVIFDQALLAIAADNLQEAENLLNALIDQQCQFNRQHLQSSQPYFYLARIYELRQESSKAVAALEQALRENPGDPWVLSHLTALTDQPGYQRQLMRYFDEIDASFLLGQAYLDTGRVSEAVNSFAYVVEKIPEYRRGQIYLSIALAAQGDYERAAQIYLTALKKSKDPIFREEAILTLFRGWAAQHTQNLEISFYLGVILREFGHYEEALDIQQTLLQRAPDRMEIKNNIDWLEHAIAAYTPPSAP